MNPQAETPPSTSSPSLAVPTPVLFLSSQTLPPLGADTWVHALLMRSFNRSAVEVHASCNPGPPGSPTPVYNAFSSIPDVRLLPVNLGPELFGRSKAGKVRAAIATTPALYSLARLAAYIRRNRIRILHTSDRPRDAVTCVLLGRLTGAKCVIHVHVAYGTWMSPALRWAIARADALLGVSRFVERSLTSTGHPPERTHAVLNSIDASAWDPATDPGPTRRALGIPEDAPVIICVARIFPPKGQAELVRALAEIRGEFPKARLVLVGQDSSGPMNFPAQLRELARTLGVSDQVLFTGQRKDVAALLAASDVYAMPSHEEPFGLAFAEALAMRKPVVALDSGGAPEVVDHGRSGLLSAPGDGAGLVRNLLILLRDPALRARMGAHGREQVEQRFAPSRQAREVEQIYAGLLASR